MNAIIIEQTPQQARMAFELHQNASIEGMRLMRAKLSSHVSGEPGEKLLIAFTFRSKPLESAPGALSLEVAFRMTGTEEKTTDTLKAKTEPVLLAECAYEAIYELREGFEASAEQVKAFKDGNAIFNAWPYFREYLQSSLQRMGLPPLVAPFLRLQPKRKKMPE